VTATPIPGPTAPAAKAASPWRRRLGLAVLVIGGGLLVERAVSLATEAEPAPAADARPRVERLALTASARSGPDAAATASAGATDPAPVLQLDRLDSRQQAASAGPQAAGSQAAAQALFAAVKPPPPAAPGAAPVAALPVAPPFPYSHLGGLLDETGRTLFFGRGSQLITVRTGDIVDRVYRVEQLSESALQLNYLPLNQPMTIRFGDPR